VAPHDFSITPNHYVIVENRLGGDTLPYILGTKCPAECVNLQSNQRMQLHLVPRLRPATTEQTPKRQIIPLESGFTIHSVAAWETPDTGTGTGMGTVELLTSAWSCEDVASGAAKGGLLGNWEGRAPNFDDIPVTLLYHTVVNKDTGALLRHAPVEGMEEIIIEHPHINPRQEGLPVRYVYMSVGSQTGVSSPPLGYLRLDMQTGERVHWYAPKHTYCEEVVVVPKVGGEGEEDVYLLCPMFDAELDRSCVGIFDGKAIDKGPVCRLWLQHHLPHSLHGCFTPQLFD
jgi:all-trans-8'-apo-beta-carotenal 15,15'-oxygenase